VTTVGTDERIPDAREQGDDGGVKPPRRRTRFVAKGVRLALDALTWSTALKLRLGLRRRKYARLIRESGLFDVGFYLEQSGDDQDARRDPVMHYLKHGAANGLDPNPLFDTAWYVQTNADVAADFAGGKNPLVHFIRWGARWQRNPGPGFDTAFYLDTNPELRASGLNPLAHYLTRGKREGSPCLPPRVRNDSCAAVPFGFTAKMPQPGPRLAAMCHLFHADLAAEFQHYLANIPFPFDLFLTTDTEAKASALVHQFKAWPHGRVEVRVSENRGRDIAPKLLALRDVYDHYEFVLHLHSKKSAHHSGLAPWRHYLLETLLGSQAIVSSVFQVFAEDPRTGLVAAQHFEFVRHSIGWGDNWDRAVDLAGRMGLTLNDQAPLDFPSGSMFWARSAALRPLLALGLSPEDFETEDAQIDGTLAHAIERLYFFVCEHAGYSWVKIARRDLLHNSLAVAEIGSTKSLRHYLSHRPMPLTGPGWSGPAAVTRRPGP
jgi:hypothetical protein